MHRAATLAVAATAVAAVAARCVSAGGSGSSPSPTSPPPAGSSAPATGGSGTLQTRDTSLGKILVDGSGRTLYLFEADTGATSHCYGGCAQAWPPDTTTGRPDAHGLDASLVATTPRDDHTTQVTYAGHPLYRFAEDTRPGDTAGQGSTAFGGAWYVLGADGSPITGAAPGSSTGGPGGGNGY
jgi:predicted lipoprotein with Yx(FWY)xxD motif